MKIPHIIIVMTAFVTLLGTGFTSNSIHINAQRTRSHRVIHVSKRHRKMRWLRRNRKHYAKLIRLEDELGMIRFNQDRRMPENNWQGQHATKNKHRFQRDYILGLSDYTHYVHSSNVAALTGSLDASFYASIMVVKRYARQHHLSRNWINRNLRHPVYGYNFSQAGCGNCNFISGVEMTPLFSNHFNQAVVRTNVENHNVGRQWINGVHYGARIKPRYYRLRYPSINELTYLKNHYVKNVYSNPIK